MRVFRSPIRLRHKIMFLAILLVMASLLISGIQVRRTIILPLEEQAAENAVLIAKLFASVPEVRYNIGKLHGSVVIQEIAEEYREQTGAMSITVVGMDGIRYSHPLQEYIDKPFQGEGLEEALRDKSFVSSFQSSLGYQVRAFAPIKDGAIQIGTVAVSFLANDIKKMQDILSKRLLLALILGLILGGFGANILADNIKKSISGLEPHEIVRLFKEREAILESVREGIIAVDGNGRINLINQSAREILGLRPGIKGSLIQNTLPNMRLLEVLNTGKAIFDLELNVLDTRILTNQVPIELKGKYIGAIASFRDMTEITSMAEELTGVKRYLEALRVHNHEFLNKLHTITGLIHLGKISKALECISESTETLQENMTFITKRIKDPSVGGLLLGKIGRCRELGITLELDKTSYIASTGNIDSNALVTIIGNLLENAILSVVQSGKEHRLIKCSIFDQSGRLLISIYDEGCGIPTENIERIFEKGFSTRKNSGGYGLFRVKELVSMYDGEIEVISEEGKFAEFMVSLPTRSGQGDSNG